jgi:glucose-1-phosphate cytidylyltransferase
MPVPHTKLTEIKTVILAGGLGTRLAEETEVVPKPMVEIGGKPILWHVMKHYGHFGVREFHVALGYKGEVIKRYFHDYYAYNGSMKIELRTGQVSSHDREREVEDWSVNLIDSGANTNTGGRLLRLRGWLGNSRFMLTYGDGVSNVDLGALLAFHERAGCLATITAVRPPARFGDIVFDGERVAKFAEKTQVGEGWINGGFMVLEPKIFDYLSHDHESLEAHALERVAADGQLAAYRHEGGWQCMDTLRDKRQLQAAWEGGSAFWKVWA